MTPCACRVVRSASYENGQQQDASVRRVLSPPKPQFVPQYGYVALFPLLMRLLPHDSPLLPKQVLLPPCYCHPVARTGGNLTHTITALRFA